MAKKVIYTSAGAIKITKPKYIVATLYTGAETDDTPLGDSFIFEDIVRDTTSISQDDNETADTERETSDTPIYTSVTLGKWQLASELADMNAELLAGLCGFTYDATTKKAYAPSSYTPRYARFAIAFTHPQDSSKLYALVLAKVLLSSKITAESLNTSLGRVAIAGTAQLVKVSVTDGSKGTKTIDTPYWTDEDYTLPVAE